MTLQLMNDFLGHLSLDLEEDDFVMGLDRPF